MPILMPEQAEALALDLLIAAGMPQDRAEAMAKVMIQTDLMGHRTHGLAFLPTYLDRIKAGSIATDGDIEVLAEGPSHFAWGALHLPGAWVMRRAMDKMFGMLDGFPVATATIGGCSHIGSLQTYLKEIGERKLLGQMMVSDPGVTSVAPFGGADPVITTNPMAAAIPTDGQPILIDQSTALVSNALIQSYAARGEQLPAEWILDGHGKPSRDPSVINQDPPGTVMPLGGVDFGYKGFGFGMMVEAWGPCLSGHGRASPKVRGGQGVFIQIIDPAGFVGKDSFLHETSDLVRRSHASRSADGKQIRLPGDRAYAEMKRQSAEGIAFDQSIIDKLGKRCADPRLKAVLSDVGDAGSSPTRTR